MGGMFTIVKVHDDIPNFKDAAEYNKQVQLPGDFGWFKNPPGTVADIAPGYEVVDVAEKEYVCPMHPEVRQSAPGKCPKCGMNLRPQVKKNEANKDDENVMQAVAPPHKH